MGVIQDAAMLGKPLMEDPSQGQPDVQNADAVGEEATGLVTEGVKARKAAEIQQAPFQKITHKWNSKTGKYDVSTDMSGDTFDYLGNLIQTGQAAQSAFQQARAQLQAKREFQERNPIIAGIGKIASSAAAQYGTGPYGGGRGRDISPIVRAAGAYGLEQFGQSNAELSQQEAGLQAQEFGVANQLYNQRQQQQALEQTEAREDRRERTDKERFLLGFVGQKRAEARQGLLLPGDSEAMITEFESVGIPRGQAAGLTAGMIAVSDARRELATIERLQTLSDQDRKHKEDLEKLIIVQEGMNARQSKSIEGMLTGIGLRTAAQQEKDAAKAQKLNAFEEKDLHAGSTAVRSIREIRQLIKDNPQYQGLSRLKDPRNVIKPELFGTKEYQEFSKGLMRKLTAAKEIGGVRAFNPTEWSAVFSRYLPDPSKSQEANLAAVDALEAEATLRLSGLGEILAARDVDLEKYPIFKEILTKPNPAAAAAATTGGGLSPQDSASFLKAVPAGKKARLKDTTTGKDLGLFENRNGAIVRIGD